MTAGPVLTEQTHPRGTSFPMRLILSCRPMRQLLLSFTVQMGKLRSRVVSHPACFQVARLEFKPRKLGSLGLTASLDGVARGPSGRWPLVLLCLGPVPLSDCQILIKQSSRSHPMSSSGGSQLLFMDPVFRMIHEGRVTWSQNFRQGCLSYSCHGGVVILFIHSWEVLGHLLHTRRLWGDSRPSQQLCEEKSHPETHPSKKFKV